MTAAEWAGDKVQGQGARRECFDARDPIPQRGRKPLRKPPNATGQAIEADFCSSLAWPGKKKQAGELLAASRKLQHYVCMGGGTALERPPIQSGIGGVLAKESQAAVRYEVALAEAL
ncbi:hypothetical protein LA080_015300 [Diaporthe eres]|nr:hypothetical protein LA080_015300 [Diaporthe eres]